MGINYKLNPRGTLATTYSFTLHNALPRRPRRNKIYCFMSSGATSHASRKDTNARPRRDGAKLSVRHTWSHRRGAGYNRSVCGRCCEREANKRQSDTRIKERRRNTHVPGGAGIPPEPQLTQEKNTATWQTSGAESQRWHNFTGPQLERSSRM